MKINNMKILNKNEDGWKGISWLIKIKNKFYIVSRNDTFDRGDETMIFNCNNQGIVSEWTEVYAELKSSHKTTIKNSGLLK